MAGGKEGTMTEQQWLDCTDPTSMLTFMRAKVSERKWRLFACACYRRAMAIQAELSQSGSVIVVPMEITLAENYADHQVSYDELAQLYRRKTGFPLSFNEFFLFGGGETSLIHPDPLPLEFVRSLATWPSEAAASRSMTAIEVTAARAIEQKRHREMIHCLVGNPFNAISLDPVWLSWSDHTVGKIAQAIYDNCVFDQMPILADALEEAGCTEPSILDHCHSGGEHVRGCWVVDLLLGKE
jgi:hypothetical protein